MTPFIKGMTLSVSFAALAAVVSASYTGPESVCSDVSQWQGSNLMAETRCYGHLTEAQFNDPSVCAGADWEKYKEEAYSDEEWRCVMPEDLKSNLQTQADCEAAFPADGSYGVFHEYQAAVTCDGASSTHPDYNEFFTCARMKESCQPGSDIRGHYTYFATKCCADQVAIKCDAINLFGCSSGSTAPELTPINSAKDSSMTCGNIKEAYKSSGCCGNPMGTVTFPSRRLTGVDSAEVEDEEEKELLALVRSTLQKARFQGDTKSQLLRKQLKEVITEMR